MSQTPKHLQPVIVSTNYRDYVGFVTDNSTFVTRARVLFFDDILGTFRELWFERRWLKV